MSLANPSKVLLLSRTTTPLAFTAYAGNPLELTLVFAGGGTANVFDGITTLRLEIHPDNLINSERIPLALLSWTSPTGTAITGSLTSAQLNLLASSKNEQKFWVVVYAITGASIEVFQVATLTLQSHPAALLAAPPPAVVDAVYLTRAAGDASYAPKASPTFTGTVSGITASMVGLGNVNNTSDAAKPVSTAQQTALDLKANIASPIPTATALATARTIALTGDVSYTSPAFNGTSNVTAAATLATTGVTAATYGGASAIPVLAIDAKGRITSASNATPTFSASSLTGSTLASGITASSLTSAAGGTFASGAFAAAGKPTESYVFEYATNDAGVAVVAGVSTFTPPVGWVSCAYKLIAGGPGGGSGRRGAAGTIRLGGTGAPGGNRSDGVLLASQVPGGNWTIRVGKGGNGGIAPITDDTNGNAGESGGATDLSQGATLLAAAAITGNFVSAPSFWSGLGGTNAASLQPFSGGGNGLSSFPSASGGFSSSTISAGNSIATLHAAVSGAGGGSLNAANEQKSPGTGNAVAQTGGAAAGAGGGPGLAPTGTATGWGTGGAGSGAGYNGATGAPGGNGTGGVAILVFSF